MNQGTAPCPPGQLMPSGLSTQLAPSTYATAYCLLSCYCFLSCPCTPVLVHPAHLDSWPSSMRGPAKLQRAKPAPTSALGSVLRHAGLLARTWRQGVAGGSAGPNRGETGRTAPAQGRGWPSEPSSRSTKAELLPSCSLSAAARSHTAATALAQPHSYIPTHRTCSRPARTGLTHGCEPPPVPRCQHTPFCGHGHKGG